MTNIGSQIREIARDDSRRFASTLRCKIVGASNKYEMQEKYIIELINRKPGELIPEGTALQWPPPPKRTYRTAHGHVILIPAADYKQYIEVLKSVNNSTPETQAALYRQVNALQDTASFFSSEEINSMLKRDQAVIDALNLNPDKTANVAELQEYHENVAKEIASFSETKRKQLQDIVIYRFLKQASILGKEPAGQQDIVDISVMDAIIDNADLGQSKNITYVDARAPISKGEKVG